MPELPDNGTVDPGWYRTLVEFAPDATVLIDSSGAILLVNAQTERLFGYTRQQLLKQKIEILIPERYRGRHAIHRDVYFGEPRVREMGAGIELWGLRRDGTEFPVEISLSPLRTPAGVFAAASIRDVSDRKKAQDQFRALLESAPDAMVIINQKGEIRLVNAQTERLFGYHRDALIGKSVEILVPEHLRSRHQGHREGYFRAPKVRGMGVGLELSGRRKDGTEFPIEISLSPLDTVEGVWATAAVRDITERKHEQDAASRLAAIVESSNDAIFGKTLDGTITSWNRAAEKLYGYAAGEIIGRNVRVLSPPDRVNEIDVLLARIHRGERIQYYETVRVAKDGHPFEVSLTISPVYNVHRQLVGASTIARDISDRKAVERKLAHYAETLEHSNHELEQFAFIVSHDLKAPLRGIASFAQMLARNLASTLDAHNKDLLDQIVTGATHMHALINALLEFSRIGRADARPEPVECEAVFADVLAHLGAQIRDRQARISHDPLPRLPGIKHEIGQLLQNLISNAIKFQPKETPVIHVSAERDGDYWKFSVRDNGLGIAPEHQQEIFKIFSRLHAAEGIEGTGIGLAICQKIVMRHGGRIWVESKPGQGSVFYFTLRASAA